MGVEWHYSIEEDVETLHTDGPLRDPVVVLVRRTPLTFVSLHLPLSGEPSKFSVPP